MERVIRFFAQSSGEVNSIYNKLFDEPDGLTQAEELWRELFTYLVENAEAKIVFDVEDITLDESTREIQIVSLTIDSIVYILDDDEKQGLEPQLMEMIATDYMQEHFTRKEMNDQLVFETIAETLKRFGLDP